MGIPAAGPGYTISDLYSVLRTYIMPDRYGVLLATCRLEIEHTEHDPTNNAVDPSGLNSEYKPKKAQEQSGFGLTGHHSAGSQS